MKKYSYLLIVTLGLFQAESIKAEWFNGPEIEPITTNRITIQSLQKANIALQMHFNNLLRQIDEMKMKNNEFAGTPKFAEQDLTNLYRLLEKSFQHLISKANTTEKESLQEKLKRITEKYNKEMKDLKKRNTIDIYKNQESNIRIKEPKTAKKITSK